MPNSLENKVVLVTGASSGIGRAVALKVAQQQGNVILAARRETALNAVADEIRALGGTALVVPTDMAVTTQVEALAEKAIAHFDRVDILVNNAGYGQMGPIESVGDAAVRQQFDVNVFGLLTLTRALIPSMRQARSGRIINLSSVAGKVALPFMGIYNASKFAVEAITDALRMELAPFGIEAIVIEPGPVETEFFDVAEREASKEVDAEASPYSAVMETMGESLSDSSTNLAWSVDRAADRILQAMTDRHPSDRYTAFTGGKLALGLLTSLPASVTDALVSRAFGLDRLKVD